MLRPDNHTLLTTALRPPLGYGLERAVGTSFSLDLVAMALTQLTFAAHDLEGDIDTIAPIALLDAVRRHAESTTLFVQGGGIAVPAKYRLLLTMLEDSIVEVSAPEGVFHPKVWALRYARPDGRRTHRLLVMSRNLTFDRSWDTMLRLDEADADGSAPTVPGQGFADFVASLPALANGPKSDVSSLVDSLAATEFVLPTPFAEGQVWTLGAGETLNPDWTATRGLLISPFLGAAVVDDLAAQVKELRVLSTPNAIDLVGTHPANITYFTLNPAADGSGDGDEFGPAETPADPDPLPDAVSEFTVPLSGLHAKVVVLDKQHTSWTFTGSANATAAGFGRNVELVVELVGPRASTGIDAIWNSKNGDPGLESLVMPYQPRPPDPDLKAQADAEWQLLHFHAGLAKLDVTTTIEQFSDDEFALEVSVPELVAGEIRSMARPLSRPQSRDLAISMRWQPMSLAALTPYLVVESELVIDGNAVTRSCVLTTRLVNDLPERRDQVLRDVLKSKADVYAYLAFLLGDPAAADADLASALLDQSAQKPTAADGGLPPIVLFEPLMRAALGDAGAIERVESLMSELARLGELDKLPEGFDDLWQVARQAFGSKR